MKDIMERHSNATAQTAAGITVLIGGLNLNELALIVGIVCSIVTVAVNWWYKHREFVRDGHHK